MDSLTQREEEFAHSCKEQEGRTDSQYVRVLTRDPYRPEASPISPIMGDGESWEFAIAFCPFCGQDLREEAGSKTASTTTA